MIDIVITVTGTQKDGNGEESRVRLITEGRFYNRNGVKYIVYKESENSGLEGVTTMLKIDKEQVVLVRTGNIGHKQEFLLGERSYSRYRTPYGTMQMGIMTNYLKIALGGRAAGTLEIGYELEIDGQWQSANTLLISIREERERGH